MLWITPCVNSKDGVFFCHVVYPPGKPEDFRSCVVKDLRYTKYSFTLDAWALKPSDFCNIEVNI